MVFQSFDYVLGFLPLLLALYLVVRRSRLASTVVLVVGSAIFYAWKTAWWLIPLVVAASVDYFVGMKMSVEGTPEHVRRRWLIFSLVVNLSLLSAFKYLGWLTISTNSMLELFGIAAVVPVFTTALPPGISFYTFETMSYTIDVYRRHYKTEPSYLVYLNFVLFFPHLVAGPILRPGDLIGQLKVVRPLATAEEIRLALCLILWGLFKKIVLADNFGDLVAHSIRAFGAPPYESSGVGLVYALGFTFQIYCDFSAYSDIARGSALLFGIKLPRDFLTPLMARSPQEFWQRWHITLSTWIRDYVYVPLGGNKGSAARQGATMLLTMGLAGLWHGAGMMFIVWGVYHGALILLYRAPPMRRFVAAGESSRGWAVLAWAVFFVLNLLGWMMFRAGSGAPGEFMLMFNSVPTVLIALHQPAFLLAGQQLLMLTLPLALSEWVAWRHRTEFPDMLAAAGTWSLGGAIVAMWFCATIFGKRSGYDFIYFAF